MQHLRRVQNAHLDVTQADPARIEWPFQPGTGHYQVKTQVPVWARWMPRSGLRFAHKVQLVYSHEGCGFIPTLYACAEFTQVK